MPKPNTHVHTCCYGDIHAYTYSYGNIHADSDAHLNSNAHALHRCVRDKSDR